MTAIQLSDDIDRFCIGKRGKGNLQIDRNRVNVEVSMLDAFYETFGVGENDAMYVAPEERIRIWE